MPGMYNHCDQGYSSGTTVCAVERNNKKIEAKSEEMCIRDRARHIIVTVLLCRYGSFRMMSVAFWRSGLIGSAQFSDLSLIQGLPAILTKMQESQKGSFENIRKLRRPD